MDALDWGLRRYFGERYGEDALDMLDVGVTDQPGLSGRGRSRERDGYGDTRAMFGRYEGTNRHNTVSVYNTMDSCNK